MYIRSDGTPLDGGYDGLGSLAQATAPPAAGLTAAEMKALRITDAIENTSWYVRHRSLSFRGLSGDFDGQGLSFGLLQWNIGTGSLQPLLQTFAREHPHRFDSVFREEAAALRRTLERTVAEQLAWARGINDRTNPARPVVREPWASHFRRLGEDREFQAIQLRFVRPRMDAARKYARHFGLTTERGLALMFDIVTQQGPYWLTCKAERCVRRAKLIDERRTARVRTLSRPLTELELLEIIANVVADVALERWRAGVRARKLMIVRGRGRVHGHDFDLQRDFALTDQPWEVGGAAAAGASSPTVVPAAVAPTPVSTRAIELNRGYAASIGWGARRAEIARLLGFGAATPTEAEFVSGVIRWQRSEGLTADGILGPNSWGRMRPQLRATPAVATPPQTVPGVPRIVGRTVAELRALVAIPAGINRGLSPARQSTMLEVFGKPGALSEGCSPVTNARLKALLVTRDVGPFELTGLRPAVEALARVLAAVRRDQPDVYQALGTAGMLCCRRVRRPAGQPPSPNWSNHSWGTAIDLTVGGVVDPRGDQKTQLGIALIADHFHSERFYWGAGFSGAAEDAMHFEASDQLVRDWKRQGVLG